MTEIAERAPAMPARAARRAPTPIVPAQNVAGTALVVVIAIMTFLSCLTLGAVTLVRDSSVAWQTEISREATIQIKPGDGVDMDTALVAAQGLAAGFAGVRSASIVDEDATARLLEPWLGTGLDLDELPVPRLVIVTIDPTSPPDFATMRTLLAEQVPGAALDDHRTWADRLVAMARTTVAIGLAILGLMLAATVLTVVFATRGAMDGNGHIIEVLHFVGAEARFIAREFRRHFLVTGLKGAAIGGAAAIVVFVGFSVWSSANLATPQGDQAAALFGNFAIGLTGYLGVALVAATVTILTGATTHFTVAAYLSELDGRQHA
jgi:cell division transport system permease protein